MNGGAFSPFVTAVVVTHNRRELLIEALDAIGVQTRPPDRLIVVDNASGDGTPDLVRDRYPHAELVELHVNTGGAGGFAAGTARALDTPTDTTALIWLMDDDTVPEPGALEALLDAWERSPRPPTLVASRVVWTDGRDHPMNTPRVKPGASRAELAAAAEAGCTPVRSASFVSVLVDAAAVRERGLPVADYFLWNDDFEFTTRLLRGRTGLYCPASVVVHKTRTFGGADADPGDRFYYEVRNKLWLFTRSRGLGPAERLLYAGSSVRRWARTYARSRDRATLRRGLRAGFRDGVRRRPRPTEDVISGAARRYDP
ncbi:glycosyltransferase [Actinomadura spongiicola]|uniref:Glycosyltransferase n=1 Tax=Actinomadura spongiicola TaxID=2303421 RepID=A0A372GE48_9ACTN|nr:glycosyltransferase [Actinomadura spongiicola]